MLLGIVSDTHGHVGFSQSAVRLLQTLQVNAVLHCGDIGSPDIPPLFSGWPSHFVFGNVDFDSPALRQSMAGPNLHCHSRFGELELEGRQIAMLHGDDAKLFRDCVQKQAYDLICYGHTHVAELHTVGRTLVLNPGALFRANPHTLATVDLATMHASIVAVHHNGRCSN